MTSTRPYLLRALYEWMVDNSLTPHILVDADAEQVEVPQQHVEDGKIILNVTPSAVRDLNIDNDYLSFSARFAGRAEQILVPISAVKAIYAKEGGEGMVFPEEEGPSQETAQSESKAPSAPAATKRPGLKIVK